jgi:hypothetical protein
VLSSLRLCNSLGRNNNQIDYPNDSYADGAVEVAAEVAAEVEVQTQVAIEAQVRTQVAMSIVLIPHSLVGDPALNPPLGPSHISEGLETLVTRPC